MENKRKTLTANDVLGALDEMEFEQFIDPLKESLEGINPVATRSFPMKLHFRNNSWSSPGYMQFTFKVQTFFRLVCSRLKRDVWEEGRLVAF